MDFWLRPFDLYCERTSTDFWAEPANAISNISIFLAGLTILFSIKRSGEKADRTVCLLAWIAIATGIGSFCFHTFANGWSLIADVVPIFCFMLVYFWFAMRNFFGFSNERSLIFLSLFLLASLTTEISPEIKRQLNGSVGYLPAFIVLVGSTAFLKNKNHSVTKWLMVGTTIFFLSLTFRTIDNWICLSFPLGTHFLWHTLNGIMLWVLMQGARLVDSAKNFNS